MMDTSVLFVLIWLASGFVVIYIGRRRGKKFGIKMDLALAFLGPIAIPFAFIGKAESKKDTPEI